MHSLLTDVPGRILSKTPKQSSNSDKPGLAVFSLSNERAGPKDRKYDPSRSHYKKVSLLRGRLIPAVGSTPTIIYSPFMEGTSGVKKTKEGNSLLWGVFPGGCPVRPPWVCCVGSALGLSAAVGSCLLRTYHTSTTTQQHNPYSNSVFDINPISPTLHSNFSFHPTHPTIRIISRILGDLSPSVLDFLS